MPDPTTLKIGDRIRILRVPSGDLQQREREIADNAELAGWTADSIERVIKQTPIVPIDRIDENGCVWYCEHLESIEETSILGIFKRGIRFRHSQPDLPNTIIFYPSLNKEVFRQKIQELGWS